VVRCELDSTGSGLGQLAGSCEHGNEHWVILRAWNSLTS